MPRLPDPNSKTPQLVVRAINDKDVEIFRKLKEICREKGVTIASKLRPAIEKIVAHEWPPNPQLQLPQFTGKLPLSQETQEKLGIKREWSDNEIVQDEAPEPQTARKDIDDRDVPVDSRLQGKVPLEAGKSVTCDLCDGKRNPSGVPCDRCNDTGKIWLLTPMSRPEGVNKTSRRESRVR